jgi:hypothetical protein
MKIAAWIIFAFLLSAVSYLLWPDVSVVIKGVLIGLFIHLSGWKIGEWPRWLKK